MTALFAPLFTRLFAGLGLTFCDARGVPDGGRITQFVCIGLVVAMVLKGLVCGRWAPLPYFSALLIVAVTGNITGLFENRAKISAEAAIAIAQTRAAAGDTAPAEGAAPLVGEAKNVTIN